MIYPDESDSPWMLKWWRNAALAAKRMASYEPPIKTPQRVSMEQWVARAVSNSTPAKQWVLMTVGSWDYGWPDEYTRYTGDDGLMSIDEWFIAPRHLVDAYETACATVEYLEAHLEAHRAKSGHRKRFTRHH